MSNLRVIEALCPEYSDRFKFVVSYQILQVKRKKKKIKGTTKRIHFDIKADDLLHLRTDPIMDTSIHREKLVPA